MMKKSRLKYYIALIAAGIILILMSPAMNIKTVEVEGNSKFTKEDILTMAKLKTENNIFLFSKANAIESMMVNPYIKNVEINKDFLNKTIYINVEERKVSGYVKFDNTNYLYVDKDGRVLEVNSFFTERHPIVEGLEFTSFVVGEIIEVENSEAFRTMVNLSHLFEKFEIANDIISIDVFDKDNIHFYYGKIDIILGNSKDLDLKVRTVRAIIPEIEDMKDIGGYLYVDDSRYPRLKLR
ncbi:MAG: FtsQ-type POTRA domain-containing protein [Lachnospiraceae bacterium]|jgi:cell division protein FtsQ|nr:FtsQ-type POTRA domain-containing protein [Lachnospiraceae bacterium]